MLFEMFCLYILLLGVAFAFWYGAKRDFDQYFDADGNLILEHKGDEIQWSPSHGKTSSQQSEKLL